ncbi:olfactory receptor 12D1-like [Sphaerodactylus townsendi]|uniref:olfactory receptor 12D1-like n=1 Tax=Sphaerodactylus townsendi TaxID=933632 RepID=UPI0020267CD0|nr:olfactory receptor 12D1-like [Sphaerodactylus townsendi]
MENQTEVTHFILLGLTDRQEAQNFLFVLFLFLYLASVLGNGAIVCVVVTEHQLHTPMYFFLSNLSCLDICYSTVIVPKMLVGFLLAHRRISFLGCITQLHFFHFLGSSEALLLAAMAYDRYVAICNPLQYLLIMCPRSCLLLAAATWTMGFLHALMHSIMTSRLYFCGPNIIEHFFCDIKPLLRLACSSTVVNLSLLNIVTGSIVMIPFVLTLLSYLYIISFLFLKVQSHSGRWKAFSTCSAHLMVVGLLYVPVLFNYVPPSSGDSPQRDMIATLMYSVVTSFLNPWIYTLRNQEMKKALRKSLARLLHSIRG